jgi:glycosyltransferase involved in cell wall biosynthesis
MNGGGRAPRVSVIVPVYNDARALRRCLVALTASRPAGAEIIVVDDGSTDDSAAAAAGFDVQVHRMPANAGPAAARNHGARHARGDVLMFVDSDVLLAPGALEQATALLERRPEIAAVFGSYDASPAAAGVVSRYKNLLHHFVHQHGLAEASTFWAGCGAIRRRIFEEAGGFDHERFARPSIEDIELGYRLRRAGHRILLDKTLQGTHLKRWTLSSLLRTDISGRAIPWARLMLERREDTDDLNVRRDQRVSAALVGLATVCLAAAAFQPALAAAGGVALLAVVGLNWRLYRFFASHGGLGFAGACVLLHWLYYLYSGLAFLYVWTDARLRRTASRAAGATRVA